MLKPFADFTARIEGDLYPTLPLVLPLMNALLDSLRKVGIQYQSVCAEHFGNYIIRTWYDNCNQLFTIVKTHRNC